MSTGFDIFKKNVKNLNETFLKSTEKKSFDDGSWKLEFPAGEKSVSATIRLLPPKDTELPYVMYKQHFFKGDDGSWCIVSRCLTTFNEACPICQRNQEIWNSGREDLKDIVRGRSGKKQYVFNILVIDDPAHPENNGKVFPWKCGPSIFNIITEAMTPQFGETPKQPFDLYKGNNFFLRMRKDETKQGLPQYDRSKFDENITPVTTSEVELEKIYNAMVNLNDFLEKEKLPYAEAERRAKKAYSKLLPESTSSQIRNKTVNKSVKQEPKEELISEIPWDTTETKNTKDSKTNGGTDDESLDDWIKNLSM